MAAAVPEHKPCDSGTAGSITQQNPASQSEEDPVLKVRFAALVAASLLGLGLTAPAALAGSTTPPPTVTQSAGTFTVSLPGVGSVVFTVDPATGAISGLVVTADPAGGFAAGTPAVTDEGVQVHFTSANGTVQALNVEVEREDGVVKVTAESEADQPDHEDGADIGATTSTTEHEDETAQEPTTEAEHEGEVATTTTPTTEAEHQATTSTTEAGHDGSGSDGGSSSGGGD
jgi:hypothetical protein